MFVLHAFWSSQNRLCLWGESSIKLSPGKVRKIRSQKTQSEPIHPFAADIEPLAQGITWVTLAETAPQPGSTPAYRKQLPGNRYEHISGQLQVLLPTAGNRPLPSPSFPLFDQVDPSQIPVGLTAWDVPVLTLDSTLAFELLFRLPGWPPPGYVFGSSVHYFSKLAKFALELVTRGRVLPVIREQAADYSAFWQPVLTAPEDAERMKILVDSLPALCRAEVVTTKVSEIPPSQLVRSALHHLVDAGVRMLLKEFSMDLPSNRRIIEAVPAVAWLAGLMNPHPTISAPPASIHKLKQTVDSWHQSGTIGHKGGLTTCFRLVEPVITTAEPQKKAKNQPDPDAWRLEFLLQGHEDKSLLVPADQVWKTKGKVLRFSTIELQNPQEKLLADLGRALRLFPELEPALKTARPVSLSLAAPQAYRFLREAAPALEQSGFSVLIPSWWTKPTARLGVRMVAKSKKAPRSATPGVLGFDGIVDYHWKLSLGDEELSYDDFVKLAKLKMPLVQIRGQWIELKPEEVERALAFFQKRAISGEMPLTEVMRLGLGVDAAKMGLPVLGIEAEGWLKNVLNEASDQQLEILPTPPDFGGKLRPYQERGLSWLAYLGTLGLGACLADDMGLGKSVQLLSLLVHERKAAASKSKKPVTFPPTLLVCPMSLVGNWQRETTRFAPMLKVHVHHGADRTTGPEFTKIASQSDLVLTTYALAARDRELLADVNWARIVLDEAQNIKNPAAKQTQAVRSFKAPQRIALTGTPVENRLSELWSISEFLNPGLLGSEKNFQSTFAFPIERFQDESKAALLKKLTAPFILRRLKTDKSIISDLPDKIEMKSYCNLTQEQASLYQAVVNEMLEKIENSEGIERKGNVLATLLRLKQVCNHPVQLVQDGSSLEGRSGKLARLEELLEEILDEGDRVLCFTQFTEMGGMLKTYLQERFGREVLYLHGQVSKPNRDRMVEQFQKPAGPPIFLLSLKAGGTGLNLTNAQHVIHYDRWWNPAVEDQATDRAFRIGQVRNVQVRKFICVGTVEERIDQMIDQKKQLAERIVGTGEGWVTELSTAQLRELISLSEDAVAEAEAATQTSAKAKPGSKKAVSKPSKTRGGQPV